MRSKIATALQITLVGCSLVACATSGPGPVSVAQPPPRARALGTQAVAAPTLAAPPVPSPPAAMSPVAGPDPDFARLAGWSAEDHASALAAFAASCRVTRDPALAEVCTRAWTAGPQDEAGARRFLEVNFRPELVGDPGLLTAYFSPVYEARRAPGGAFTAPVRPRPADLPADASGAPAYSDRAAIEARPARGALAWMRPEDLFFLQIQGSGVLAYPDGSRSRAVFDGTNGAPFRGVAAVMRQQGLLADQDTSGEAIRSWLASHRGPEAAAIMRFDPRYVFFRLIPDDGVDPAGAAGLPLIPGRTVAVDTSRHALGEMFWIDATAPGLTGAFPAYRRLAVALDTGGAIRGEARADLYMGRGPAAGLEAGRVRHVLRLYRLTPRS
jgi:membrane-bound lytic murein transglycosylase A